MQNLQHALVSLLARRHSPPVTAMEPGEAVTESMVLFETWHACQNLRLYYIIGKMEKKMEATIQGLGFCLVSWE